MNPSFSDRDQSSYDWASRQRAWQRRLPRLRLEAEPIEQQVERYRRATITLSLVTAGIAGIVFALFSVFGAPLIGLLLSFTMAGAVISAAWRSHRRLRQGAERYLLEYQAVQAAPPPEPTTSRDIVGPKGPPDEINLSDLKE